MHVRNLMAFLLANSEKAIDRLPVFAYFIADAIKKIAYFYVHSFLP